MTALVVGGDTYGTLAEFKTYLAARPWGTVFTGTSDDVLQTYLVAAFDTLSALAYSTSPTTTAEDETVTATTWVKRAQFLEAMHLFIVWSDSDTRARLCLRLQGVTEFTVDRIREKMSREPTVAGFYSATAFSTVKPYLMLSPSRLRHDT